MAIALTNNLCAPSYAVVLFTACAFSLSSCASSGKKTRILPPTPAENSSGFGYIPLDGLAITEALDTPNCRNPKAGKEELPFYATLPLLELLPDLSVRFAVASFGANGALSFGPAKVTTEGSTYRAVLDYVNVDALPVEFYLKKFVRPKNGGAESARSLLSSVDTATEEVVRYEARIQRPGSVHDSLAAASFVAEKNYDQVTIPIYVGIGMRLSADIRALRSNIALTSLATIAAEAQDSALAGTLTVQTLGLTGRMIATALPLPSKLDQTTVENGILALGSSRASLYASDTGNDVTKTPRVVGLYSPVGSDPRLINVIYSELSRARPVWVRLCSRSR